MSIQQKEISKAFGLALRALRQRSGFNQNELAAKGISRSHLNAMEHGETDPKLSTLLHLAVTLEIPFMALAREIERYREDAPVADAHEFTEDAVVLPGKILLISPHGSLNASGGMNFFVQIFELALARNAGKICLNVIDMAMDFSMIERHRLALNLFHWLKERSFVPHMAVVVIPSSGVGAGADMVRSLGVDVRVFSRQPEALAWLRSFPE